MDNLKLQDRLSEKKNGKTYNESLKAHEAYIHYRDMGIQRSLRKLHERYTAPDAPTDCPTKRLSSLEDWSSRWRWQERLKEWNKHQTDIRAAEDEQARLDARIIRKKLLDRWYDKLDKQMFHANLGDFDGVQAFRAMTDSINKWMEQSRKEHNDLPTQKTDLTSGGKEMSVIFNITPPED